MIRKTSFSQIGKTTEHLLQAKRNECLRLVRASNRVINKVRYSSAESPEHIAKKKEICAELEKQGKHYICEAIFITGGRADILVLDDFSAIEIVKTEPESSIARKRGFYPQGIITEMVWAVEPKK